MYGNNCLNHSNIYKWVEQFQNGRASVYDEWRSVRPVEVATPSLESWIDSLIRNNRRITVEVISEKVNTSVGTVHKIIHDKLRYKKKQQTDVQRIPTVSRPTRKPFRLTIARSGRRGYSSRFCGVRYGTPETGNCYYSTIRSITLSSLVVATWQSNANDYNTIMPV